MQQYEIRSRDLKAIFEAISFTDGVEPEEFGSAAIQIYQSRHYEENILVLHEWETDAEADKARLEYLKAHSFYIQPSWGYESGHHKIVVQNPAYNANKTARLDADPDLIKAIDAARNAPKPKVTVIATPDGMVDQIDFQHNP